MKKNEIDIRIILDEEVGLYSIIYNGETIAECLSFDEIAETTILDIVDSGFLRGGHEDEIQDYKQADRRDGRGGFENQGSI